MLMIFICPSSRAGGRSFLLRLPREVFDSLSASPPLPQQHCPPGGRLVLAAPLSVRLPFDQGAVSAGQTFKGNHARCM